MTWTTLYRDANSFQRTVLWTLGVTFFLIFVGGLVRAAGAGLGCPDWPRCFGYWIPPTSADALPPPYDPAEFNAVKTWLEYINRLVGVTVGFLILTTFIRSIPFRKSDRTVFFGALAALVLVLYQGWLGGQVVRSGLEGWMITVHMIVAVLILNVLLFTAYRAMREKLSVQLEPLIRHRCTWVLGLLIAATILQVALGAQVREALAMVKDTYPDLLRGDWIDQVGTVDIVHRSFSWIVLGGAIVFYRSVRSLPDSHGLRDLAKTHNSLVVMQILLGVALVYGGLSPALQIFHLVAAAAMTSVQFLALLITRHAVSA